MGTKAAAPDRLWRSADPGSSIHAHQRYGRAGCDPDSGWGWIGAISTAVGIGAALSQMIAGSIVHHFSFNAGFLFLAAIAAVAFGILYFLMPETRDKSFLKQNL